MSSVTVSAKVGGAGELRFAADVVDTFTDPVRSAVLEPVNGLIKGTITGLDADTAYFVAVEIDGIIFTDVISEFRTPVAGAHSFSFATASCAASNSNALIFDNITALATAGDIDFFVHLGDAHYENIMTNSESVFNAAWNAIFASPRQAAMWAAMPVYYIWDDHDYGPNDSDSTSSARAAALAVFRSRVPTPVLGSSDPDEGVYYSFVRGRVRFVVTDLRSERSPKSATDDASKSMMSATQLAWFFSELSAAEVAGQAVVWANTVPWIAATTSNADHWGGYTTARAEIVDYIDLHELNDRIMIISGDMHALAFDDGTNAPGGIRVCQCAPLDRSNHTTGGPYSSGAPVVTSQSQYGLIDVTDSGSGPVSVRYRGVVVNRTTGDETTAIDVSLSLAAG